MASGYPDYWMRVAPQKSEISDRQTPVYQNAVNSIDPEYSGTLIVYTVPAGYNFYLTRLFISTGNHGPSSMLLTDTPGFYIYQYFDTQITFDFGEGGLYPMEEGDLVAVSCENKTIFTGLYYCTMMGYLVPVTP